jgi:ribose transport system permease protein
VTESSPSQTVTAGSPVTGTTSPPRAPAPSRGLLAQIRRLLSFEELGTAIALAALVLLIGAFHPDFLAKDVLLGTLRTAAFVAIIAYGMVFLLAMTELDLSVGGIYAVSIVLAAKWMSSMDPYLAALLAIGVAVAMGLLNGLLTNVFRIPVIIITLGTLSMYRGLVTVISDGKPVDGIPIDSSFFTTLGGDLFGVPVAGWIVLVLGVVLTVVFNRTRFGAMVRAIGSNRQAAEFSGIPVGRIRIYALMLVGGLAGLSGVLSLSYFQGADPTIGIGLELQVIAAAIIGGTAVSGGTGTVPGALLGALIVAVINSGLVFFSVGSNWSNFVTGAVIVVAVGTDALVRRRRADRALRVTDG